MDQPLSFSDGHANLSADHGSDDLRPLPKRKLLARRNRSLTDTMLRRLAQRVTLVRRILNDLRDREITGRR